MSDLITSIVIVNYNGGRHLNECLTAIYKFSDVAFEVIVVDNASTDGSVADLTQRYPNVRLIESNANLGYAKGINLGVSHSRGLHVVVLNMDVIVEKDWLSPLIEFLEERHDVGVVTPCIMLYEQPDRINAIGQNVHVTGLGFNRKLNRPSNEIDPSPVQVSGLQGGAFALRSDLFRKLDGMNEAYFLYHEDVELSLRLKLAGYSIYAIPDSVVRHKYHLHMTPQKLQWLERHRWLTILGTYRFGTLLLLMPLLILTEMLMVGYCLTRGISFVIAKVQAAIWVLSHWNKLKTSRLKSQKVRCVSDWKILSGLRWGYEWDQFLILARQRGGWLREAVSGVLTRRAHDRSA